MAASVDGKLGSTENDGSLQETSDDVNFKDPLLSGLDKSGDEERTESLNTDNPPAQPDATVTQTYSPPTKLHSERDEDDDTDTSDVFVKVDNPEKHTSTLEAYITFRVSTKTTRAEFGSSEFTVRRRFNDFVWLRQQLEQSYPTHLVPPLPQKHSLRRLDHFSLDFVRMRQNALQKFLTRLADHPVLSFDKNFYVFLTTKSSEFQSHKKQGKGIFTQVTDSLHSLGASYMLRNRPAEFSLMHEYVSVFGDKVGVMDRVAARVLKEQTDYRSELCGWPPYLSLWAHSEDQLKTPLLSLATAVDQCCHHLQDLIDKTDDHISQPLKEYVQYTECIKAVLRRRDAIQMEYDRVVDELNKRKDEREQVKISDQTYSLGSFLGKDPQEVKLQKQEKVAQQISELNKQKELLNDKTEVADANLKADMERWHKTKLHDVKEILIAMADRQIQYYEKCLSVWQDAIRGIQKKDGEEEEDAADTVQLNMTGNTRSSAVTTTVCATTTTTTAAATTSGEDNVTAVSESGDVKSA